MTTGTNTAEMRSASRCTGALPDWASLDQPGHLGQRGVGADARGPHDEAAAGVHGGADHGIARRRPRPGTLSPVTIDASTAELPSTTTPSVAIFSPGPHDEPVARRRAARSGRRTSWPVARARPRPWPPARAGPAGPTPARRLARASKYRPASMNTVTAGGDLEVEVVGPRRAASRPIVIPGSPASPKNSAHSRPAERGQHAERDERVHRRGAVAQVEPAARWKGQAPHVATGAARVKASHCQFSNWRAGIIDSRSTGRASTAAPTRRWRSEREVLVGLVTRIVLRTMLGPVRGFADGGRPSRRQAPPRR